MTLVSEPDRTTTPVTFNATGICPFCGGQAMDHAGHCTQCGSTDSSASRHRVTSIVGPWQILDPDHPGAQGINFQTLKQWITTGRVTARSVVRGPTTAQLWKAAGKVKGLSRELGLCYSCDTRIDRTAAVCPHCNRSQTMPFDPDMLLDTTGPVPLPAPTSPLSTQPWIEEAPLRPDAVATPRPHNRRPFRRDLLLTPAELAKVFSLDAGPVAEVDHSPRRSNRMSLPKLGRRTAMVGLLAVASIAAVVETWSAGPMAWAWLQKSLLTQGPARRLIVQPVVLNEMPPALRMPAPRHIIENAEPTLQPLDTDKLPAMPALAPKASAPAPVAQLASEPEPADVSPTKAIDQLWKDALSAESQRKFSTAIARYEQIQSYPDTFWPHALDVRLKLARQESASGLD